MSTPTTTRPRPAAGPSGPRRVGAGVAVPVALGVVAVVVGVLLAHYGFRAWNRDFDACAGG